MGSTQNQPKHFALESSINAARSFPAFTSAYVNKTDQVRLIGNSVCPDEAEALVSANAADIIDVLPAAGGATPSPVSLPPFKTRASLTTFRRHARHGASNEYHM
jgi:hypothetical protein